MFRTILQLYLYVSLGARSLAVADCARPDLIAATDLYVASQAAGAISSDFSKLISPNVAYTENRKTANLKTGMLSNALKIDHNRSTHDTTACATYTEFIVTGPKPYVFGTQIRFTDGLVTKMDSVITTTGDWAFNASGTLRWASVENWGTIPEAKRDSRATIQAAADSYANLFNNKSVVVPWGTPCDRLEGGSYTGTGKATDSCDVGVPSGVSLTNRTYVIDETLGTVDMMMSFATLPDSHEFRLENGKIRYVHTMTVMH